MMCGSIVLLPAAAGTSVSNTPRPGSTPPILKPAISPRRNGSRPSCSAIGTSGRTATLVSKPRTTPSV